MANRFFYSMDVNWRTDKGVGSGKAQIYAFKPGGFSDLPWTKETPTLDQIKRISDGADGARSLTVCSDQVGAHRYLESKRITSVSLSVFDIDTKMGAGYKLCGFITIEDIHSSAKQPVDSAILGMSAERPAQAALFAVVLDFHDSSGGSVFTRS